MSALTKLHVTLTTLDVTYEDDEDSVIKAIESPLKNKGQTLLFAPAVEPQNGNPPANVKLPVADEGDQVFTQQPIQIEEVNRGSRATELHSFGKRQNAIHKPDSIYVITILYIFQYVAPFKTELLLMLKPTEIVSFIYAIKAELRPKEIDVYLQLWREIFVSKSAVKSMVENSLTASLIGRDLLTISSVIARASIPIYDRDLNFTCELFQRKASILIATRLKDVLPILCPNTPEVEIPDWFLELQLSDTILDMLRPKEEFTEATSRALGFKVCLDDNTTGNLDKQADVDVTLLNIRYRGLLIPESLGRRLLNYPDGIGQGQFAFINLHWEENKIHIITPYENGSAFLAEYGLDTCWETLYFENFSVFSESDGVIPCLTTWLPY
jgi:hypothetical protein